MHHKWICNKLFFQHSLRLSFTDDSSVSRLKIPMLSCFLQSSWVAGNYENICSENLFCFCKENCTEYLTRTPLFCYSHRKMSQTSRPAVQHQESSFILCSKGLSQLPQPLKIVALLMNQDFNPRLLFLQQILAVHEDTEGECFPQDMAFIYSDGVLFSSLFFSLCFRLPRNRCPRKQYGCRVQLGVACVYRESLATVNFMLLPPESVC